MYSYIVILLSPFKVVSYIIGQRGPSEVVGAVVLFIAVNVIDGSGLRGIRVFAERRRHQSADQKMLLLSVPAQRHTRIALVIHEGGQQMRFAPFGAFDAAHIADKIMRIVLDFPPYPIRQIGNNHDFHLLLDRIRERPQPLSHYFLKNSKAELIKFDRTFRKQILIL